MYNILTLNKIAACGTDRFDGKYSCSDSCENPTAVMVRSASMHETTFAPETLAIARAGAGTNNIPVDKCAEQGIVVFNTPGANANAVKELVICGLLLASRKVTAAYDWCKGLKGEGDNVTAVSCSAEDIQSVVDVLQMNADDGAKAVANVQSDSVLILLHALDTRATVKKAAQKQHDTLFSADGNSNESVGGNATTDSITEGADT